MKGSDVLNTQWCALILTKRGRLHKFGESVYLGMFSSALSRRPQTLQLLLCLCPQSSTYAVCEGHSWQKNGQRRCPIVSTTLHCICGQSIICVAPSLSQLGALLERKLRFEAANGKGQATEDPQWRNVEEQRIKYGGALAVRSPQTDACTNTIKYYKSYRHPNSWRAPIRFFNVTGI